MTPKARSYVVVFVAIAWSTVVLFFFLDASAGHFLEKLREFGIV